VRGGRDDAFFNDLPGFFRSINYAPQFYHVPHTMPDVRELKIPKTFLELEGNDLFNYDPHLPQWGHGIKKELPSGPLNIEGDTVPFALAGNRLYTPVTIYDSASAFQRAASSTLPASRQICTSSAQSWPRMRPGSASAARRRWSCSATSRARWIATRGCCCISCTRSPTTAIACTSSCAAARTRAMSRPG
jgi:hypothetical protein